MNSRLRKPLLAAAALLGLCAVVVLANASQWVGREFPGFLVLRNGVVASAGLAHWPATATGELFQHTVLSYDGTAFVDAEAFHAYIQSLPAGTGIEYKFGRGDTIETRVVETRTMSRSDALLLFGATFLAAIAFLGVAAALLFIAPKDPASVGSAVSFGITGVFALTALDLYGPYYFFKLHAVAECFLGAGTFHMALVFPYRRALATSHKWLIPSGYACATALGLVTALLANDPSVYVTTHGLAIVLAGVSFLTMVLSQAAAFIWPRDYESRQRVQILALGTLATVTPGVVVLLTSALSGGGAAENAIGWTGAFFPISVAYAVLRSDALGVDAIIRRTVTYTVLTLLVGASYAAAIGSVELLASGQNQVPRWISILLFSAFCTFAVLPLRDRVQSWVDKSFFRSVYDFRNIVESTSATLARLTDLSEIKRIIEIAAAEALQPESVDLAPAKSHHSAKSNFDESPSEITDIHAGGITIPFRTSNRTVAVLTLGRRLSGKFYSGEDRALLAVLANQGAIAIENAMAIEEVRELNRTLERRVRERTAELADALDELTKTQSDLVNAERMAAIGEIAAGVAHEVNNPLNFAQNSLRALESIVADLAERSLESDPASKKSDSPVVADRLSPTSAELADDARDLVEILGSGLKRTAKLVAELRDFAAPTSRHDETFDLASVAEDALALASSTLQSRGVAVDLEASGRPILIQGNCETMGQVLLNLIKNSIDALERTEEPHLRVSARLDAGSDEIRLVVADNGEGIAPEVAEQVFDPFFTTKDAGEGTGLGLAICKRIVSEHRGEIWVESPPEGGTEMHVTLPACP